MVSKISPTQYAVLNVLSWQPQWHLFNVCWYMFHSTGDATVLTDSLHYTWWHPGHQSPTCKDVQPWTMWTVSAAPCTVLSCSCRQTLCLSVPSTLAWSRRRRLCGCKQRPQEHSPSPRPRTCKTMQSPAACRQSWMTATRCWSGTCNKGHKDEFIHTFLDGQFRYVNSSFSQLKYNSDKNWWIPNNMNSCTWKGMHSVIKHSLLLIQCHSNFESVLSFEKIQFQNLNRSSIT